MRVLLAAGGTGGHLFPAEALATVLSARGHAALLVTDDRAVALVADFPAESVSFVPAATLRRRDPLAFAQMAATNALGMVRSIALIRRVKPDVVVGFGGYPTLPPLTAARALGVPSVVHEANAVIGRANRRLAPDANVATSFPEVRGLTRARSVTQVGIPVRRAVVEAARPWVPSAKFALLVFGGSQGARAFADLVPPAIAALSADHRARLVLTQQCRPEDLDGVRSAYGAMGVAAELAPFFRDLPARIAEADLVIARAGASTVAEVSVIGRAALLVPLPGALDQDQAANAAALQALGGALRLDQDGLTPERLAAEIAALMDDADRLGAMAQAAGGLARPDAAERLADLCERVARRVPAGAAVLA